jgi:Na+/pantothenate symporter
MSPTVLFAFVLAYFAILLGVAWLTSRNANNDSFFIGNRNSNWMLVAFGMVGTSLSGVTFISVPGAVGTTAFTYFQIVLGHFFGYLVIAFVLLPLYYRLNVTSIYHYLDTRLGRFYQTGASFFIPRAPWVRPRASTVVKILQEALTGLQVPFWLSALDHRGLLYTYEGGVRPSSDRYLQTTACSGLVICVGRVLDSLNISLLKAAQMHRGLSTVFSTDPGQRSFGQAGLAGMFIDRHDRYVTRK